MKLNSIPKLKHTDSKNFFLLAGPCAIEGEDMALQIAEKIIKITDTLKIPYIFKGSFKKLRSTVRINFVIINYELTLLTK